MTKDQLDRGRSLDRMVGKLDYLLRLTKMGSLLGTNDTGVLVDDFRGEFVDFLKKLKQKTVQELKEL